MRAANRLQCNFVEISLFIPLFYKQQPAFKFQVNSCRELFALRYASMRGCNSRKCLYAPSMCFGCWRKQWIYMKYTGDNKNAYIPLSEWHEMFMSSFYDAMTVRCVLITLTLIRNGIRQCDAQHTPTEWDKVAKVIRISRRSTIFPSPSRELNVRSE